MPKKIATVFARPDFIECPPCRAKPGSPYLCFECLERRELYSLISRYVIIKEKS